MGSLLEERYALYSTGNLEGHLFLISQGIFFSLALDFKEESSSVNAHVHVERAALVPAGHHLSAHLGGNL